jgi:hypothetical protein
VLLDGAWGRAQEGRTSARREEEGGVRHAVRVPGHA